MKGDQWKTIFTIVKVALIVLLCGPCILQCVMNFVTQRLVVFSQIGGQRARVQYIFMNDAHTPKLRASSGETEGGNRTGSIFKAGLHLGPDYGLWAICPVSMETRYQLENLVPGRKSPRALHCLKEYLNYLCNWIEPYILLCLLGYDHRPIDNCPLLTT